MGNPAEVVADSQEVLQGSQASVQLAGASFGDGSQDSVQLVGASYGVKGRRRRRRLLTQESSESPRPRKLLALESVDAVPRSELVPLQRPPAPGAAARTLRSLSSRVVLVRMAL